MMFSGDLESILDNLVCKIVPLELKIGYNKGPSNFSPAGPLMCWTFSCVPLFRTCRWRKGDINKSRDKQFDVGTWENFAVSEIFYVMSNRRDYKHVVRRHSGNHKVKAQLEVPDKSGAKVVGSHWKERETLHLRRTVKFGVNPSSSPRHYPVTALLSCSEIIAVLLLCPNSDPPVIDVWSCRPAFSPARWGRHNLGCRRARSASYLTASSSLLAL